MWTEMLASGKVKYVERYEEPLTGEIKRVSVTMDKDTKKNQKLAQEALREKIQAKQACVSIKKEELTIEDLVNVYISYKKAHTKASTWSRDVHVCNTLCKLLGPKTLVNRLTAGYIREKITGKPGTVNERITRLKVLLRWGYANDYIKDVEYLHKLKMLPDEEGKKKLKEKYLEVSELKKILDGMELVRWRQLTEFLVLSGVRIGEALALDVNDVDMKSLKITINKTYDSNNSLTTTPKTYSSSREIDIQPELAVVCRDIRKRTSAEKLRYGFRSTLFMADVNGGPLAYDSYRQYLHDVSIRTIGRKITPHTLRHTHTSLMAAAGVPLEVVSRRLGHNNSRITRDIYFHITEGLKQRDREEVMKVQIL